MQINEKWLVILIVLCCIALIIGISISVTQEQQQQQPTHTETETEIGTFQDRLDSFKNGTKQIKTQEKSQGKRVFSFSLYGTGEKYSQGMLENLKLIQNKFPDWEVWIYLASDVLPPVIKQIQKYKNAKVISVPRKTNAENMPDRFLPIDDPSVDIMIVRDADSRVYDRDVGCILDFMQSDKKFHIILDHCGHRHYLILGGMWGIKKGALSGNVKIQKLLTDFKNENNASNGYGSDQEFLRKSLFPLIKHSVLFHDGANSMQPEHQSFVKTPFRIPLHDVDFIGQTYEADNRPVYKLSDFC